MESQRNSLAEQVPVDELKLYHSLLASRGGLAVVTVERGMCMGCRITLPIHELQRVRTAKDMVFCSSCRRILYLS